MIKRLRNGIVKVLKWFGIVIAVTVVAIFAYNTWYSSTPEGQAEFAQRQKEEAEEKKAEEKAHKKAIKSFIKNKSERVTAQMQILAEATSAVDMFGTEQVQIIKTKDIGDVYETEIQVNMVSCVDYIVTDIAYGVCAWDEKGNPLEAICYLDGGFKKTEDESSFIATDITSVPSQDLVEYGATFPLGITIYTKKPVATAKCHISYVTHGYIDIDNGGLDKKYENVQSDAFAEWSQTFAGAKLKI